MYFRVTSRVTRIQACLLDRALFLSAFSFSSLKFVVPVYKGPLLVFLGLPGSLSSSLCKDSHAYPGSDLESAFG